MIDGPDIYENDFSGVSIATGDLFFPIDEFGIPDRGGVVLTPMCDLVQKKIKWIKLAFAIPFKLYLEEVFIPQQFKGMSEYSEEIAKDPGTFGRSYLNDPNKREDIKTLRLVKDLQKILRNTSPKMPSHYYLPGKEEPKQGFLVDFSYISSVSNNKLEKQKALTRLKSPWREQLLNRYVNFSSRVGTPDYSEENICKTIQAFYPELTVEKILKKMK